PYMDNGCHRIELLDRDTLLPLPSGTLEVAVVGNSHYSKDWIGITHVAAFDPERLRGAYAVIRDVGAYCEVLRDNWTETRAAKTSVLDGGDFREIPNSNPAA